MKPLPCVRTLAGWAVVMVLTLATQPLAAQSESVPVVKALLVDGGPFLQGNRTIEPMVAGKKVTVSSFWMAETETTQRQYKEVTGSDPSWFHNAENPVEKVSWYEAIAFCNLLSVRDGLEPAYSVEGTKVTWNHEAQGWRLPTEAEFEFAARGGLQGHDYAFPGSGAADEVGWSFSNSGKQTRPVKSLKPNELNLYGLAGNVWEWCWDWYTFDRSSLPEVNPQGPLVGSDKVNRGGGWNDDFVDSFRPYFRADDGPDSRDSDLGFRVVRNSLGL
ncbi:MAG: SUMF1/EgtB/PvdO family nonheme iron enzyme [Spirochaetales bacterium]